MATAVSMDTLKWHSINYDYCIGLQVFSWSIFFTGLEKHSTGMFFLVSFWVLPARPLCRSVILILEKLCFLWAWHFHFDKWRFYLFKQYFKRGNRQGILWLQKRFRYAMLLLFTINELALTLTFCILLSVTIPKSTSYPAGHIRVHSLLSYIDFSLLIVQEWSNVLQPCSQYLKVIPLLSWLIVTLEILFVILWESPLSLKTKSSSKNQWFSL